MDDPSLSQRQEYIFEFICTYQEEHGYPPSVREIGYAVGLASPSTVHMHLKTLEEHGYIKRNPNKPRTIEIVPGKLPGSWRLRSKKRKKIVSPAISLPLIKGIFPGVPVLAVRNIESIVTLPIEMVGDDRSFVMRVEGESMLFADLDEGDFLVVKEDSDIEDGDTVLLLVDGKPAVKSFYQEEEEVRLESQLDDVPPIYLEEPKIIGRVTSLIRSV